MKKDLLVNSKVRERRTQKGNPGPTVDPKPKPGPQPALDELGSTAKEVLRELDLTNVDFGPDYFDRMHDQIMSKIERIEIARKPNAGSKTRKVMSVFPIPNSTLS